MGSSDRFLDFLRATLGEVPSKHLPTPGKFCRFGGTSKPMWALLFEDGQGGIAGDWRDNSTHVWQAQTHPLTPQQSERVRQALQQVRAQRERQQRQQWACNAYKLRRMMAESLPVEPGSPVAYYLTRRLGLRALGGFVPGWQQQVIRYAPALPYFDEDGQPCGSHPAMLAALTSPQGELVAIHRTWLTPDGQKAHVPGPVKKLTSTCGPLAGAGIVLFSGPDEQGVIGIAEGIETALAASLGAGVPVCAAYSASNLAAWCWPEQTRRLLVFADHDPAGQKAAQTLLGRALGAGLQASILTPSTPGQDWCDVWAQRAAKAVQA
ncbi:hypothetical protein VITFI_CDS0551 [Vitreoscilla filiformis]|uniref:Uncharacterized protein n=1 Tax=Vitreoscilla filiformis TaxID=63 RepID=A0A221KBV7_VITFI|nr:hypothetical protein VITFI_CDS0551 [Vitreoscilla filiformis]